MLRRNFGHICLVSLAGSLEVAARTVTRPVSIATFDKNYDRYYFTKPSGETQWSDWTRAYDEKKNMYYYNVNTQAKQWEEPKWLAGTDDGGNPQDSDSADDESAAPPEVKNGFSDADFGFDDKAEDVDSFGGQNKMLANPLAHKPKPVDKVSGDKNKNHLQTLNTFKGTNPLAKKKVPLSQRRKEKAEQKQKEETIVVSEDKDSENEELKQQLEMMKKQMAILQSKVESTTNTEEDNGPDMTSFFHKYSTHLDAEARSLFENLDADGKAAILKKSKIGLPFSILLLEGRKLSSEKKDSKPAQPAFLAGIAGGANRLKSSDDQVAARPVNPLLAGIAGGASRLKSGNGDSHKPSGVNPLLAGIQNVNLQPAGQSNTSARKASNPLMDDILKAKLRPSSIRQVKQLPKKEESNTLQSELAGALKKKSRRTTLIDDRRAKAASLKSEQQQSTKPAWMQNGNKLKHVDRPPLPLAPKKVEEPVGNKFKQDQKQKPIFARLERHRQENLKAERDRQAKIQEEQAEKVRQQKGRALEKVKEQAQIAKERTDREFEREKQARESQQHREWEKRQRAEHEKATQLKKAKHLQDILNKLDKMNQDATMVVKVSDLKNYIADMAPVADMNEKHLSETTAKQMRQLFEEFVQQVFPPQ